MEAAVALEETGKKGRTKIVRTGIKYRIRMFELAFGCIVDKSDKIPTQAGLFIHGLGIRGLDYPRTVKWAKTEDNKGNFIYSCLIT